MMHHQEATLARQTQLAYICMRLLGTPSWYLFSVLVYILYKYAEISSLQITVIVALKPASSLLAPYWSQAIYKRPDRIVSNLISANLLRYLPFLFTPWIEPAWFLILSFGLYMTLTRATMPAWMEMLKTNLPSAKREQMVSFGTTIDYLGTALLAVIMGAILDFYPSSWKWLFSMTAAIGMLSTFFLSSISSIQSSPVIAKVKIPNAAIKEKIIRPWKQVLQLVTEHKDFTIFQVGFMLGGAGLMIMHPALPKFFIDTLHLSFVEMGLAISLCKAVGVALTSQVWTRLFRRINIFQLCALVTFFATLFPFFLLAASWHLILLYLAYALYGIMQAGSELSWHMSGLVFAQEKDSSTYSVTNVLTVGIRGCAIPALGSLLLPIIHPLGVMLLGAVLCLAASGYFMLNIRKLPRNAEG